MDGFDAAPVPPLADEDEDEDVDSPEPPSEDRVELASPLVAEDALPVTAFEEPFLESVE